MTWREASFKPWTGGFLERRVFRMLNGPAGAARGSRVVRLRWRRRRRRKIRARARAQHGDRCSDAAADLRRPREIVRGGCTSDSRHRSHPLRAGTEIQSLLSLGASRASRRRHHPLPSEAHCNLDLPRDGGARSPQKSVRHRSGRGRVGHLVVREHRPSVQRSPAHQRIQQEGVPALSEPPGTSHRWWRGCREILAD